MSKRNNLSTRKLNQIKELNKKISKKNSNIRHRYGVETGVGRIDTNAPISEINHQIEQAKRFLNRHNQNYQYMKNDHGTVLTRKEWNQYKRTIERANRIKKQEYNKLAKQDYIIQGQRVGKVGQVKLANLKTLEDFRPLKIDINRFWSRNEFVEDFYNKTRVYGGDFIKRQREQYRQNYIQALLNEHGDTTETRKLIEKINGYSVDEFYLISETVEGADIHYVYDKQQQGVVLNRLNNIW